MKQYRFLYFSERVKYDRKSGLLFWKERPKKHFPTIMGWRCFNSREAGTICGKIQPNGYIAFRVDKVLFYAHRVAWVLETKQDFPIGFDIDHIDRNRTNNAFSNLRLATKSQNSQNKVGSRSLPKGVSFDRSRGGYQLYITASGKTIRGRCQSLDEAMEIVRNWRKEMHGDFYNNDFQNAP